MQKIVNKALMIILVIIPACNNDQNPSKLQIIDVENNIKKLEIIQLSNVASNIQYIPLESNIRNYLSYIDDCRILGNYMILSNLKQCFLFTTKGKFIRQIGKEGRGPGEYIFVENVDFDRDTNIYIQSMYDLLKFQIDGTPIEERRKFFLINNSVGEILRDCFLIEDSLFLGHLRNTTGLSKYKALLMNGKGELIKTYKNYILFEREKPGGSSIDDFAHIYKFRNSVHYKEFYNDTLFYLDEQLNMIPKYFFSLGKYKEPSAERAKFALTSEEYVYIWEVYQTEKYIFFSCQSTKDFTSERITPMIVNLPGKTVTVTRNTDRALGVFNKHTETISFCEQTITDNRLSASGIYNDIDAGPRFFPTKQINDSTLLMWLKVDELKKHIESDDFKNTSPVYPGKKKQFEEMVRNLNFEDNGVLMFVTFK